MAHGPVTALVTLDMKGPVAMGAASGSSKVGRAEAWGRVHHVDNETMTILGVYAKYTTIVYGE